MGFGIKTKIIKTYRKLKRPEFVYRDLTTSIFPKNKFSKFKINTRLNVALNDVKSFDVDHNIGLLSAKADRYAVEIYQKFISLNPNNIGNWSIKAPNNGARQLEFEVIQKMIDLYNGKKENLEGYVTSGGSEGNLFSVWVGKSFVSKKYKLDQICLLKTNLTHYSIDKGCVICSMKYINVPVNPTSWTMDPKALETEMVKQIKAGVFGFVISLTFGFTETGTSDDLKAITQVVTKLKKKYKKIAVSIIIDAAFNGLIEPFMVKKYAPFITKDVHVYSVDFSKFTAIPFPAGVALYRKELRKIIERDVQFFPVPDNTLLGSRPGSSAAAIWGVIHSLGVSGYKELITKQLELKEYFLSRILEMFPTAQIINTKYGLSCGIILSKKDDRTISKEVEGRFMIYAKHEPIMFSDGTTKNIKIYKFFFMQHMTKKAVDEILNFIETNRS